MTLKEKRLKELIRIDKNLFNLRGGIKRVPNIRTEVERQNSWVSRRKNDRRSIESRDYV